jgi:hypothetical protein
LKHLERIRRAGIALLTAIVLAGFGGAPALADTTPTQVSCTPASGSINAGSTVSCSISLGTGASLVFWNTHGFSPLFSHSLSDTFTASAAGDGSITATWQDSEGAHQQTFSYTIAASSAVSTASCSPNGGAITLGSSVSCSFSPAPGTHLMFWTARGFSPLFSHNLSDSFTATRLGAASIIATYSGPGGAHQIEFDYTVQAPTAP